MTHPMIKPPFYTTPPARDSSRLEQLSYLRKLCLWSSAMVLPLLVVGLVFASMFVIVVCLACWLIQACIMARLELRYRAERLNSSS